MSDPESRRAFEQELADREETRTWRDWKIWEAAVEWATERAAKIAEGFDPVVADSIRRIQHRTRRYKHGRRHS